MDSNNCNALVIVAGDSVETDPFVDQELRVGADGIVQIGSVTDNTSSGDIMWSVWLKAVIR